DEEIYISLVILLVEAYLNTDHITKVIDIFEKVCNKYPHNDLLKQNKDHLASIKGSRNNETIEYIKKFPFSSKIFMV
ncbi:hypothetical protein, partial [Staphylococcus pseudintermedius]|uniref:hypothetical protein n=1 Tax=Staphylococcus pseudintermedius TaxID=283734 RepID=UPI0027F06649